MTGAYERISKQILSGQPKTKKTVCRFRNGRLICGTASQHLTKQGRQFRMFWRLKFKRALRTRTNEPTV